jgi:hypothetical protein
VSLQGFRLEVFVNYLRPGNNLSPVNSIKNLAASTILLASICFAQDAAPTQDNNPTVTIPAGTHFALVLTHPVQSRVIHHGDDIYAQITAPINSGNEMVIPPGTFFQGTVDKLEQKKGRGDIHLQSMAITFPDGYVAPVAGPITLESNEGYAIKDPGGKRTGAAILMPLAGVGLGALIGHSVGTSQSTLTTTLPPGCMGPPPQCLSSTIPVAGSKGRDAAIGASIGGIAGGIGSIFALLGSHHFFLDVGSPVELTLQQPITLQEKEVVAAVKQSEQHPVSAQPVLPRPVAPAPSTSSGTCYTPGTPGTPPTVIPGPPGPDGIPGPPTVIPGTPPTPGTPYPCP